MGSFPFGPFHIKTTDARPFAVLRLGLLRDRLHGQPRSLHVRCRYAHFRGQGTGAPTPLQGFFYGKGIPQLERKLVP